MDFDLLNLLNETSDLSGVAQSVGYGQDMATAAELAQMQAQYPDWLNQLTGVTQGAPSLPPGVSSLLKTVTGGNGSGGSLLGTALGGLLGSTNGAKQAGTTTVTQAPWSGQQPFLLDAFQKAKDASSGGPLQTRANANYQAGLQGPMQNPMLGMDNPYLVKTIDNANSDVNRAMLPAMNQANRASGSFGNSGVADIYGKALTDAYSRNATSMRMLDYTNQQGLNENAVNRTLGLTTGANTFAAQPAQNYAQTIQGNYGGSTSTPYYNNPVLGAMGGMQIGNQIGYGLGQTQIGANLGF